MPYEFRIDAGKKTVFFKGQGHFSNEEFFGCIEQIAHHPDIEPDLSYLVDMTEIESHDQTYQQMRTRADLDKTFSKQMGKARIALVAVTDSMYGMLRMYQTLMQNSEFVVEVFRSLERARKWLGLPVENSKDGAHNTNMDASPV